MVKVVNISMVIFYSRIIPRVAQAVVFKGFHKEPRGSLAVIQGLLEVRVPGGGRRRLSRLTCLQDSRSTFLYVCVYILLNFVYLFFLAVLHLYCFAQDFSSCDRRGYRLVALSGLLIAVVPLVEHGLLSAGVQ